MEVVVEDTTGIPSGSILSVRAGTIRRQGSINCKKAMRFGTSLLEASPFLVDVYVPLASARLTLTPNSDRYAVSLNSSAGEQMHMDLSVKELPQEQAQQQPVRTQSRQARRQKQAEGCQDYVERHKLVQFMQNLMQSLLVDRPDDPYAYMEQNLRSARPGEKVPPVPAVPTPKAAAAAPPKQGLRPHAKEFQGVAFTTEDTTGALRVIRPVAAKDIAQPGSRLRRLNVHNLCQNFTSAEFETPLRGMTSNFRDASSWVTEALYTNGPARDYYQMLSAGPRKVLHFVPKDVVATIVTCGGLCPGLNSVVRQIVQMLYIYGVSRIYGIRGGYKGVVDTDSWVELTPEAVQDIHDQGGTVLASDRGNPPVEEQAAALQSMGVRQHFVIGGDGTHRGAYGTYEAMKASGWECAVVGIPKTIDNDIPMLDRTFGFDTACTEAAKSIHAAYTEATCNANCIGLVKLMGRHCGYIAMNACLAARYVDVCLLPEMEISAEKLLSHCVHLMQTKGFAVIVVAEGCGNTLLQSSGEVDEGGNVKLADVGPWLRDKILGHFKKVKLPLTIKYIDPTYMIRAIKPNANDSIYCAALADCAVHAAMAGFTGMTIGKVCGHYAMLPIQAITQQPPKRVDLCGRWFVRLVSTTRQPGFMPDSALRPSTPGPQLDVSDGLVASSELLEGFDAAMAGGEEVRRLELEHLSTDFGRHDVPSTLEETVQGGRLGFLDEDAWMTQALGNRGAEAVNLQMLRAGPRRTLHFKPEEVAAAIVTCGGLCPGLNSVIRELVMMLYAYGVRKVYGIRGGFKGAVKPQTWLTLTPENVRDIHIQGGTVLVSDRGNPTSDEVAEMLRSKGVRQYYVIGGDGTHRGAYAAYEATKKISWECAVVGVPKTIDNDIDILDRTFGFDTACSEAIKAINTAYVEATCNANCIGLVKLMGRHCGYLTMMSVLAARYVDICLLPEMDVSLDKVLAHCVHLMKTQGYAVVVVAEGCGDTLISGANETDAGGNKKLADAGVWLKETILAHFKTMQLPLTIKYVDPTYMVRAVPANPNDSIYCSILAQAAVHGAMAGYTGMTVAMVSEAIAYLPMRTITGIPNRHVDVKGEWFERLLAATQQPNLGQGGAALAAPIDPTKASALVRATSVRRKSALFPENDLVEVNVPSTRLVTLDGFGAVTENRPLARGDLLPSSSEIRDLQCFNLSERFGCFNLPSPLKGRVGRVFQDSSSWTTQAMFLGQQGEPYYKMVRAGPRDLLHFDPCDPAACAAIVTCGGICPGLNDVIRELVMTLCEYGVRRIYGIRGGYKGVVEQEQWLELTPEVVKNIHMLGGTMLVSDRGNPTVLDMAKALKERRVRQLFVLGGDGTHKGAMNTFEACLEIGHECSVIGVPKTIDNDVPFLDQTFGFDSACTEAEKAVDSAYVEATCNANCIGLVKLMGRHCGFIAMNACLAARHVDICLLPEMDIDVEKVLQHAVHLMKTQRYAVIVVAEGCGDTLIQGSGEKDAGGNKLLADAGAWLKGTITKRFKELDMPLTIKYIDPTYMIRSVPANAFDSQYCAALAQNAVHGAMAGYSGVTVGKVSEQYVMLPIHAITMQKGRRVDTNGRWFHRLLETTKQPDFAPDGAPKQKAAEEIDVLRGLSKPSSINEVLLVGDEVRRLGIVDLGSLFPSAKVPNPMNQGAHISNDAWVTRTLGKFNRRDGRGKQYFQALQAGPRAQLHFDPAQSCAVIVTCGGICPGLNSVIRELVMTLDSYGVPKIFGCRGGYKGMVEPENWMQLTPKVVQNIHMQGGTILVSDRGNPATIDIARSLQKQGVTQYFVIGGDGTHSGAMEIFNSTREVGHNCAVVGVPKTIDNDIPVLDRSFGFNTACTEAVKAISSAYTEAASNTNCIGLVKLMGRHCGWIAMEATLATRNVDICLLPEMKVSLPKLLSHSLHLIKTQGRAVIVVAEGCGDTLMESSGESDAGGNKKLADVGPWLQQQLLAYFKKMRTPLSVKFIDPTYTIRAVPANANDSIYCSVLAQHAVHGAMAGFSGVTVGKVNERFVMLPIHAITRSASGPRNVKLDSPQFERLLSSTGQPDLSPGLGDDWALLPPTPTGGVEEEPQEDLPPDINNLDWSRQVSTEGEPHEPLQGATLRVVDGFGNPKEERALELADVMAVSSSLRRLEVMSLSERFPSRNVRAPIQVRFVPHDSWCTEALNVSQRVDSAGQAYYQLLKAGPREFLHFDPSDSSSCAAILTSGGLCPGENAAIREIVMRLHSYGVTTVYGITNGFGGIVDFNSWMRLSPDSVRDIHLLGGTILKSQRGRPPTADLAAALKQHGVRQLFALGGDGTHKGMLHILTALAAADHECACVAVPATINNDIQLVDRTFGFDTACTVARDSINAAYVEATCNANCIGLVKMTGQHNGFLALETVLASRHVDICLVPEMEISLDKVLDHCEATMASKGYAVVVVAEGCRDSLLRNSGQSPGDVDIGLWLRDMILARFKSKSKTLTIKYMDPTYTVRSAPANANDSVYTTRLASHAVHAAMAGLTGVSVARVYERYVYMPIQAVNSRKCLNPKGRWMTRMLFTTKQPGFEPDGFEYGPPPNSGLREISTSMQLARVLLEGSEVRRLACVNLGEAFASKAVPSPIQSSESAFVKENSWSTQTLDTQVGNAKGSYMQLLRCGPRATLHFDPSESAAAIVTCGGLCPGLNSVIRELALLLRSYGVPNVYGIRGGYNGCRKEEDWIDLTQGAVQDIHMNGGSMLVSDRGNPPVSEIAEIMKKRNIRQFFVLGGDGTHKGAMATFQAMSALGHECAVVGVPKTIDNDIQLIDQSFGFQTACTEAEKAISSAYVESTTNANCIGLVKLMGRHCGWIATYATLANRNVDVCLIPEMNVSLQKLLGYVASVMRRKRRAVIVVAEGCGDTIIEGSGEVDAGGNKLLADVGLYLKDEITRHCKEQNIPVTIKYIDPTYMIRSVPANAFDSQYCAALAQEAVHAAMAGYTGISVGKVDNRYVMLPIHAITSQGPRKVSLTSRTFEDLMEATEQPSLEP